ncbi:unnamed protein product [Victoria cruziana]
MTVNDQGQIRYQGKLWISSDMDLRNEILGSLHSSKFLIHLGGNKMYRTAKRYFWWPWMRKDIADFVAHYLICQQVKTEHQKPHVDKLSKSAHFLAIHATLPLDALADLHIREIVRLHGVPKAIVLDRDPQFTSRFWKAFQSALGMKLKMSSTFHL